MLPFHAVKAKFLPEKYFQILFFIFAIFYFIHITIIHANFHFQQIAMMLNFGNNKKRIETNGNYVEENNRIKFSIMSINFIVRLIKLPFIVKIEKVLCHFQAILEPAKKKSFDSI